MSFFLVPTYSIFGSKIQTVRAMHLFFKEKTAEVLVLSYMRCGDMAWQLASDTDTNGDSIFPCHASVANVEA